MVERVDRFAVGDVSPSGNVYLVTGSHGHVGQLYC